MIETVFLCSWVSSLQVISCNLICSESIFSLVVWHHRCWYKIPLCLWIILIVYGKTFATLHGCTVWTPVVHLCVFSPHLWFWRCWCCRRWRPLIVSLRLVSMDEITALGPPVIRKDLSSSAVVSATVKPLLLSLWCGDIHDLDSNQTSALIWSGKLVYLTFVTVVSYISNLVETV